MLNGVTKQEIQKLFESSQTPDLGPGPRPGIQPQAELNKCLQIALGNSDARQESRELIQALVLLWHDHLDAAHELAQAIPSSNGSFIHGIMHRREPDYGNAAYWFRRVGKHPAFDGIAERALKTLEAADGALAKRLIPGRQWDPFAFITACEEATAHGAPREPLRKLQAIETLVLLDWICEKPD